MTNVHGETARHARLKRLAFLWARKRTAIPLARLKWLCLNADIVPA
jgi:hypothetical protein